MKPARSLPTQRSGGFVVRGFTLIEVLLSIAIFSVLAGVVTVTMFGGISQKHLEEGSQQFETVLRMVRAESANQGRRMRIAWRPSDEQIVVMWEPQPLAQPGQFVAYTGSSWEGLIPNTMVRIVGSHREGADEADALTFGKQQSASALAEAGEQVIVDFYPDGSAESTTIELASRELEDERRAIVVMDGVNYFITTRILAGTELVDWQEQQTNTSSEMDRAY